MLSLHDEPGILTIDVAGAATMVESPAVHETASERMSRGVRVVRIDLRDCVAMDSTFSGTLLALKRELDRLDGTLTLVSPSPKVVEVLAQMGLDGFYDVEIAERACRALGRDRSCAAVARADPERRRGPRTTSSFGRRGHARSCSATSRASCAAESAAPRSRRGPRPRRATAPRRSSTRRPTRESDPRGTRAARDDRASTCRRGPSRRGDRARGDSSPRSACAARPRARARRPTRAASPCRGSRGP